MTKKARMHQWSTSKQEYAENEVRNGYTIELMEVGQFIEVDFIIKKVGTTYIILHMISSC